MGVDVSGLPDAVPALDVEAVEAVKSDERARVAAFLRDVFASGKPMDADKLIAAVESGEFVPDAVVAEPDPEPMATIGELLAESWRAHGMAAEMRRQRSAPGLRRQQVERALSTRLQAHELDPTHSDPAWALDGKKGPNGSDVHADAVTFYRQQLGL